MKGISWYNCLIKKKGSAKMNETVLMASSYKNTKIEIIEHNKLSGAKDGDTARYLYFAEQQGIKMKYVKVTLNDSKVTTESGALYYSIGQVKTTTSVGGVGGMIGKMVKGAVTQEKAFTPVYEGTGVVVLEPTFSHYIIRELKDESFILDRGIFFCSVGDIEVSPYIQKSVSGAMFGSEGLFQTRVSGTGVVVMQIPVPMDEVVSITLDDEIARLDGDFAILRSESIKFTVQRSTKSVVGTVVSGEGFLSTFKGSGTIWITPTAPMYARIRQTGGIDTNKYETYRNNSEVYNGNNGHSGNSGYPEKEY